MSLEISKRSIIYIILLLLICSTALAYWKVDTLDFLSLDDEEYVCKNVHVTSGFTGANVRWAFSTFHAANWHPVTWLSHMLDCRLYGLKPAGHHLTNLLFHLLNTILVFVVFMRMTGSVWKSALVGALFGLHPIHVESVAWVSERKDVLSAFFMMTTLLFYTMYVSRKKVLYLWTSFLLFTLGLMAKPMLVTLPFILVLIDYWPLRRTYPISNSRNAFARVGPGTVLFGLAIEKIPFFVSALLSCIITLRAQSAGAAVIDIVRLPLVSRSYNAIVSYCLYLGKTFWPAHLSAYYVHSCVVPLWQTGISLAILSAITFVFIALAKRKPQYIVGWLWFLGMLVPVIGLVQVGGQAMADRYAYVPLVGLAIVISWGLADAVKCIPALKYYIISGSIAALCWLAAQTRTQVQTWKNDLTVADHVLSISPNNYMACNLKGNYYLEHKQFDLARKNYLQSLTLCPSSKFPLAQIGWLDVAIGNYSEAIAMLDQVLKKDSLHVYANVNRGTACLLSGKETEALSCYSRALRVNPSYVPALFNSGLAQKKLKHYTDAEYFFSKVVQINPVDTEALFQLGVCFGSERKPEHAIRCFNQAIAVNPHFSEARDSLFALLKRNAVGVSSESK